MAKEEIKSLAVKLALEDGSFQQGIANLKQNLGVINSEFKASVSGVKDWGKNLDALKANATALGEKIKVQKNIVAAYTDQLQKSKETLSDNSKKMIELKSKVEDAKSAWEKSKSAVGANAEATKQLKNEYNTLNENYIKSEKLVKKNNSSVNGYTIQLNKAKGALNGMESELTQTNSDIKNFDKNALKAAASSSKMAENINKKVNKAIKTLTVSLTAAVAGMTALGKSSLEGASDLEGYRATLNVVMKDTRLAGETFAWAINFANKTPFETDSIVQATVRMQSYGLKAKEVLPAIGDMAGVMGKDIMQAVEAVADAQTGELERMKEFGITKQMIIDKGNEIMRDKELVNKQGQITDQANFNKALFALMEDKFSGGMEIQANSFKGLWSTVTGVFKTSLSQMMGITDEGEVVIGGAFDIIKSKIKEVAETLQRWSKDGTIKEIGDKLQAAFKGVVDFIEDFVLPAFKFMFEHIDVIKGVVTGVVAALTAWKVATAAVMVKQVAHNVILIASAVAHGGLTAATTAATTAQWGLNAAMTANPIGLVVVAIGALVAAIGGLIWWHKKEKDAAKQAAEEEIAAAKKAAEERRAENAKIAAAKKAEINDKIAAEEKYHTEQSALLQKEYDEQLALGEKKLSALKDNLSERQRAEDKRHNEAIKAIQDEYGVFKEKEESKTDIAQREAKEKIDLLNAELSAAKTVYNESIAKIREEYGVFEEKQVSKTQLIQDEYNKKSSVIADILKLSENAATQEGKAFATSSEYILEKAQKLHNEKIAMYSEEYLLSIGVINSDLSAKIKAYQDEIKAIENKTDEENAVIKAQNDEQKLLDLQKKVDAAKSDEERLAANKALQEEITRQNREKLLEQRNDKIDSLNQKIKDATSAANEEKSNLLKVLKGRIADEQIEIKKNTKYNIGKVQEERKAKEKAEADKLKAVEIRVADEIKAIKNKTKEKIAKIQEERIAKEKAETAKYEAAKKSMDNEGKYLENWIDNVYKPLIDEQYQKPIDKEKERHELVMKNYEKELEAAEPPEVKKEKAMIEKLEQEKEDLNNPLPFGKTNNKNTSKPKFGDVDISDFDPDYNKHTKEQTLNKIEEEIEEHKKNLRDMGVPGFSSGVTNFRGGLARLHELGGEIVNLPRGTNVIPHDVSMQIAKSMGESVSLRNTANSNEINLHFHVGTLVGSDGMDEFASIMSQKIAGDYGLTTGGSY